MRRHEEEIFQGNHAWRLRLFKAERMFRARWLVCTAEGQWGGIFPPTESAGTLGEPSGEALGTVFLPGKPASTVEGAAARTPLGCTEDVKREM